MELVFNGFYELLNEISIVRVALLLSYDNHGTYVTFLRNHVDTNRKADKILPYSRKERKIAIFTLLEEIYSPA